MSRRTIDLDLYDGFRGPYSQGATGAGLVFTSGQVPFDLDSGRLVDGSIGDQVVACLRNVERIVEAAGSDLSSVVRCGVYVRRYSDFEAISVAYGSVFSPPYPARTLVTVADLPTGVDVIIEAVAVVGP
jgi:2-iminobutanoate/2-iminopropanoate deaminase